MSTTYAEQAEHNGQHAPTTPDPRTPVTWDQRPDEYNPYKMDEMGFRLPFGDLPNKTIPASWAAIMLTELCANHRDIWARLSVFAMTGEYPPEVPKTTRGRPAKPPAE